MAHQTGKNIVVGYRAEATFNTPPGTGSATQFRVNPGSGLTLARQLIESNEVRSDGKSAMARLGHKKLNGAYAGDVYVGAHDGLIEAVMRGTWTAAASITQATMTSITTTTSTIVAAGGSWLTQGVRVGDIVKLTVATGMTASNLNKWLRVTGVTASTITIADTLVLDAVARTTFTLVIAKKVTQPNTLVRRSFTFDEYDIDIDLSEQYTGCRICSMKLTGQPNGMAIVEFGIVGAALNPLATGASPYYISPTLNNAIGLVMVDAVIRVGGSDVTNLTSFDLMIDLRGDTLPVLGSTTTPDVYENNAKVTGTIAGTREDFTNLNRFINETEVELQLMMVEPESDPKDFLACFVPRVKFTGVSKPIGNDGAMIETIPFTTGSEGVVTGYDDTMVMFNTSAA